MSDPRSNPWLAEYYGYNVPAPTTGVGRIDEAELQRQRALKYGEPWTPRGIAMLPNRIADIGNQAIDDLHSPSPHVRPWLWSGLAWFRLLNALALQDRQRPPAAD
jgi:hypothetical protein